MTLKELIEAYKEDIEFVVKKIVDDEPVEVVSFNASELDAIKTDITDKEVSKWYVEVANKVPAYARIIVIIKNA